MIGRIKAMLSRSFCLFLDGKFGGKGEVCGPLFTIIRLASSKGLEEETTKIQLVGQSFAMRRHYFAYRPDHEHDHNMFGMLA